MKKNSNANISRPQPIEHNCGELTLLFVLGSEDKPGMLLSNTLPTADILSGKNVREWVSMDFT